MANWRTVDENDLAATLSQKEIDKFRRDVPADGSDAVARLLERTVSAVRGWIGCNPAVRMGPKGTIPCCLVSPAMDYAALDVLKRVDIDPTEARREARRKAEELFEKIATGQLGCESYAEDENAGDGTRHAGSPAFADATPERLLD